MLATQEDTYESDLASGVSLAGTYVTLELSGVTIGVAVRHVREILDLVEISPLPSAPHNVEGLIDIRGASIPIVDMRHWLGLSHQETGADTRIVVFEIEGQAGRQPIGIFADRVKDVTTIVDTEIEAPPEVATGMPETTSLVGVARKDDSLIFLLNVTQLFGSADLGGSFSL
ncbi:MAG: chemotaxis protein CheW [Pseudomonadota bacterium]